MKVLVIGCSLDPQSRSQTLARHAVEALHRRDVGTELVDLRQWHLPLFDGRGGAEIDPAVPDVIAGADAILLAVPIYNYSAGSAAKNLIEWTGRAWRGQIVGFLCAAGGPVSYMAPMGLANSLLLDFQCLIVPQLVYVTDAEFEDDQLTGEQAHQRIDAVAEETIRLTAALRPAASQGSGP
jgi:NAD(P)H-dependent FMN reductase